jgi:hypothetical protein
MGRRHACAEQLAERVQCDPNNLFDQSMPFLLIGGFTVSVLMNGEVPLTCPQFLYQVL